MELGWMIDQPVDEVTLTPKNMSVTLNQNVRTSYANSLIQISNYGIGLSPTSNENMNLDFDNSRY